jgi:hypothetical protein
VGRSSLLRSFYVKFIELNNSSDEYCEYGTKSKGTNFHNSIELFGTFSNCFWIKPKVLPWIQMFITFADSLLSIFYDETYEITADPSGNGLGNFRKCSKCHHYSPETVERCD